MTEMIHKYWCGKCRKFTEVKDPKPVQDPTCQCGQLTRFLETVQGPVEDTKRMPPCLEEWVHAGYSPAHYELRFSTPEWGPTWSNPNWKPEERHSEPPKPPEPDLHEYDPCDNSHPGDPL